MAHTCCFCTNQAWEVLLYLSQKLSLDGCHHLRTVLLQAASVASPPTRVSRCPRLHSLATGTASIWWVCDAVPTQLVYLM